ncbi:MAG TPA: cell division protein FtsQ [Trinickia sp.]|nr:cell division protein FtsQ [Trinickia sp.]
MSDTAVRQEPGTRDGSDAASEREAYRAERAHRPMAACLLALLAGALALGMASLVTHARTDAEFAIDDGAAWRNGEAMRRIDRAIDVPYASLLRRAGAAARYRLLGDLGPQVREGCPGWLFYADGLRPAPASLPASPHDAAMSERIATLHRYADALRRDGKTLVVVTVPDKARVETEALCGLRQDPRMTARWDAWRQALAQAGIAHVDLLDALRAVRPAFYRTDVHWNARGAQAAADVVAQTVLPLVGGRGPARFTFEHGSGVKPRMGDLVRLAGLDAAPDGWRPALDVEMPETIRPEPSGGLLDDTPPAQVLLAGCSFSRRSGFADRLGQALGREVWNVSVDDGRFDRALAAVWRERASWPAGLRVVIWEMSEDALSEPPAAAKPSLPEPEPAAAGPLPRNRA